MVKLPSWADFSHMPAWSLDYFPSSEGRETEQKLTVFPVSREQHTRVLDARALADPLLATAATLPTFPSCYGKGHSLCLEILSGFLHLAHL